MKLILNSGTLFRRKRRPPLFFLFLSVFCCFVVILLFLGWLTSPPDLVIISSLKATNKESTCKLLAVNGKHNRNLNLETIDTVYLRTDAPANVDNDKFLSNIYHIDHRKINKIRILPDDIGADKCRQVTGRRVLMNYADDGCCRGAQQRNCQTGLRLGGFDVCISFSNWSLYDPGFVAKNCDLLSQRLWLWKPYLIFQTLLALDDGDILFYADSGSEFVDNIDTSLVCLQHQLQQDVVVFSLEHPEYRFTKEDVFVVMNCDNAACRNSPQRLASFILFRKSRDSLRFVSEWLTYAQDRRLLSNDASVFGWDIFKYFFFDPETWRPRMGEHRHDQSILSLLSKKWSIESWPDPSNYGEFGQIGRLLKQDQRFQSLQNRFLIYHSRFRD